MDLYQVFIDLTKVFDNVNRTALWKNLTEIEKFFAIRRSFHDDLG